MKVRWTRAAVEDVTAALDHIAESDPDRALDVLGQVMDAVSTLADGRFDGPITR